MASRAGQKRSAASNSAEASTSSAHTSKKTRFVEPDDDPANFAEQVDSALETRSRRGKVKSEGYESDSSDDGEGVVNSRKKGKEEEEEEEDMFAMADKEEKAQEETGKKKDKFMRLGDIEGQEFHDESGENSDDEDFEDEDARERKKKEGMGFELSSFNMREEMEEGKFTDDGNYIRTFDPHQVHDKWMDGLDEREIKLARKRKREQEKKQKEKMDREERELQESGGPAAVELQLLPYLKKGETILEALQRLGAAEKRKQPAKKPAKRKADGAMSVDKQPHTPTDIEVITDLASKLMSLGDVDVYSKTYEELVRHVRTAGNVESNWEPPSADVKYEYKWDKPGSGQTDQVFGPFSEEDMRSWYKAAYFGTYGEQVKVRRVGGEWGDWDDVVQ
ncbi:hypothetical protein EST38_g13038 [Candolleomyces aberdarensis]|uniref:GYF domain-containing protein n=1 Tax=Candolleomyces aberdarensis TaxID=2316362 RepID=A0A4Q2D311_9AGAR|nr:hypothetical protein EST38_g13038 [Candolleomyces aberdarensis]